MKWSFSSVRQRRNQKIVEVNSKGKLLHLDYTKWRRAKKDIDHPEKWIKKWLNCAHLLDYWRLWFAFAKPCRNTTAAVRRGEFCFVIDVQRKRTFCDRKELRKDEVLQRLPEALIQRSQLEVSLVNILRCGLTYFFSLFNFEAHSKLLNLRLNLNERIRITILTQRHHRTVLNGLVTHLDMAE